MSSPRLGGRASPGRSPGSGGGPGHGRAPRLRHVDGLRALAVLLVVGYHAGVPALGGGFVGVDVFFVLSGFLITGLLLGELQRTGTVDLPRFWARRARRLLPAATLVLLVVLGAGAFVVAPIDRPDLARESGAAALFAANWFFAASATDYWASDGAVSPLLHYWSLAVEEQFYLLWPPLLVLVVRVVGRYPSRPPRRRAATPWSVGSGPDLVVAGLLGLVLVVSLSLSAATTAGTGTLAYYGLHTRAWELALGGLVAVALRRLPAPGRAAGAAAAATGLGMVLWSATTYSPATVFPGVAALLPTVGTALVLLAGAGPGNRLLAVLGAPIAARLGEVSYAWYLWHWPVLVLVALAAGGNAAGPGAWGVGAPLVAAAVLLSLVLAVLTNRLLEDPVRFHLALTASTPRSLALGGALVALALVAALATGGVAARTAGSAPPSAVTEVAAGPADGDGVTRTVTNRAWDAASAREDLPTGEDCHESFRETRELTGCVAGDPDGEVRVAFVGDSHAFHWLPAVDLLGQERGWRVEFWSASGCPLADVVSWLPSEDRSYVECDEWRHDLLDELQDRDPYDLVLVGRAQSGIGLQADPDGGRAAEEDLAVGYRDGAGRTFDALLAAGSQVVVLQDTPWPGQDVPECLSSAGGDAEACRYPLAGTSHLDAELVALEREAAEGRSVTHVDTTPLVCDEPRCPVLTPDGVVVFRDAHHLTATYAATVADDLGALLAPHLP